MVKSVILATGFYLPEKVVTNDELAKTIDTSDEWIVTRTGIKQRHIASDAEPTSYMAAMASERAIAKSGVSKNDIDAIIVATTTPDKTFPSTAAITQAILGIKNTAAFDIQAVCSGFVYALSIADNMIRAGGYKNILVIGADKMSSIVDWTDRSTAVLFGDGAGAVVLSATNEAGRGIIAHEILADGSFSGILHTSGGTGTTKASGHIIMQGQETYKKAIEKMSEAMENVLKKAGMEAKDIDFIVPHQANHRIISSLTSKLGLSADKVILTLDKHANNSAATIPLALDLSCDKFKRGDNILLTAAGGGWTWGAVLLNW